MTRHKKVQRTTRRRRATTVLTCRDYDLLSMVGLLRHVSTDQIARELFPNSDRARRRVRQLFDACFIDITLISSNQPNLVSLTRQGIAALVEERSALAGRINRPAPLRLQALRHHLLVSDTRLYAASLGKIRGAPLVGWSGPGGHLHTELGMPEIPLVPDGLAEFSAESSRIVIAIEADCGTEAMPMLEDKFLRYCHVADAGHVDALWFVADGGVRRLRGIAQRVADAGLSDWVRVLSVAHVNTRPVRELPPRGGDGRDEVPNTTTEDSAEERTVSRGFRTGRRHG